MDRFHGVPLDALLIESIDWTHRADRIRTRSVRKLAPREFKVEPV
jgi:hypothetical protein